MVDKRFELKSSILGEISWFRPKYRISKVDTYFKNAQMNNVPLMIKKNQIIDMILCTRLHEA